MQERTSYCNTISHNLVGSGTAANVEEVGRGAAVQLDDVHGGHGKPGAVNHAADIAVEGDVVQVEVGCCHLAGILLRPVSLKKPNNVFSSEGIVEK